ncbi:MAG: hypothetical protein ACF8NJ_03695 [Phycisphaerales bacterium JB038]
MQRETKEGVIIACDFTGADWDGQTPMIEGHRGSVLSLPALGRALEEAAPLPQGAVCTMCLRTLAPGTRAWAPPEPPPTANPEATVCWDCIQQADRAFARDADTDWERRLPPDANWS